MKKIIIINKIVFFNILILSFFFNLESKRTLNNHGKKENVETNTMHKKLMNKSQVC